MGARRSVKVRFSQSEASSSNYNSLKEQFQESSKVIVTIPHFMSYATKAIFTLRQTGHKIVDICSIPMWTVDFEHSNIKLTFKKSLNRNVLNWGFAPFEI